MPKIYALLRVSRDKQDPENQKYGLLEYANARGLAPIEMVEEVASRSKDWRQRKIGQIIATAERGDVILTSELSRIAGTALTALEILKEASERGLIVHVTKQQIVMDGSLQSDIMATMLGLAAQIERHFIQARTTESLRVAKERGVKLGRPKGSVSAELKLDSRIDEVRAFVNLGVPQRRAAQILKCSPATLNRFIKTRKIKPTNTIPTMTMPGTQNAQ